MNLESPKPFVCDEGSTMTAGVRWAEWLRDFEIFAAGSGLVDENVKVKMCSPSACCRSEC